MTFNFLGLGVQKAGTSTLHDILKQHPQIFLPDNKEAHFFDLYKNYQKGKEWLFHHFYTKAGSQKIIGKFTPEYIYVKEVPVRIAETFGTDIKFLVVLRNPVDRAVSHYNMVFRRGLEKEEFWKAAENEPGNIKKSELSNIHFSYISRGLYAKQLKRYFDIFPRENFLILVFEKDIVKNLEQTVLRIQDFLGVERVNLNTDIISNEGFAPKSVQLNRLVRNKKIKRFFVFFLSKKFKKKMKKGILELNKKEDKSDIFKLEKEAKRELFDKYFCEDVKQLESLLNTSFKDVWY